MHRVASFPADCTGGNHMTAFIRSMCLAALLAAGSAWAQTQQTDNPDNPHSTKAKDKQSSGTATSDTNQQVQQGETANPHSTQYTKPAGQASSSSIDAAERNNPDHPQSQDRIGTSANAQTPAADRDHEMSMLKNATPDMQLQKLHKVNQHEIEMGKLAEQNGSDRVKTFARTLIRDHQDADKKVMDLAKKKNVSLSETAPAMSADKQRDKEMKKDRLSSLKGTDFDREFANEMAMGHKKVISLAQAWTQDCKDKDVCNLLTSLMPTLQQHEQMAERLRAPAAQGRAPEPTR
jgi:putative membrane protein